MHRPRKIDEDAPGRRDGPSAVPFLQGVFQWTGSPLQWHRATGRISLANEATEDLVGLSNEFDASADGWALISPYGDFPHSDGLQRVTRESAETMVGNFKSLGGRIKRAIFGLPIFKGHPDVKAFANIHRDRTVYGVFADLEARAEGFYGKPILTDQGEAVVESGEKYLSPHWKARKVGLANGQTIFEPVVLASVGLTARPNIPGRSLVNSQPNENIMIEWIKGLLGLGNEATEDEVKQAVQALHKRPEPTALANEQTARVAVEGERDTLRGERDTLESEKATAETAFANERKARVGLLVDGAVKEGRILEADRAKWTGRLERDFEAESGALANEKAALKTGSTTAALGNRKVDGSRIDRIQALVNEEMPKTGHDYDKAFANVKRAHPGLFEEAAK